MNLKKTYRIYRDEGLSVKKRKGKKRTIGTCTPLPQAQHANHIWSLDFMSDALEDGRRFRILGIMDQFGRPYLDPTADTSISGERVALELDRLIERYGKPEIIVSDNGTEFTSKAILQWVSDKNVQWHYITPGKRQKTASQKASTVKSVMNA